MLATELHGEPLCDPEIFRQLEQTPVAAEQELRDIAGAEARIIATFFCGLKDNGVPVDVAAQITLVWHGWHPKARFWLEEAGAHVQGASSLTIDPVVKNNAV